MKQAKEHIETLDDFIRSDFFAMWDSDNKSAGGCGVIMEDSDRYDRILEAAKDGADGSTHGEVIEDWRGALDCSDLPIRVKDRINRQIDRCEQYHIKAGTINEVIG